MLQTDPLCRDRAKRGITEIETEAGHVIPRAVGSSRQPRWEGFADAPPSAGREAFLHTSFVVVFE